MEKNYFTAIQFIIIFVIHRVCIRKIHVAVVTLVTGLQYTGTALETLFLTSLRIGHGPSFRFGI